MGLMDFFKKKLHLNGPDPLNLTLASMKKGYYVDYDMKTWQVTSCNRYEWGPRDITWEWQLQCHDDVIYLEREHDDEDYWSISRKIPFSRLDPGIREKIIRSDEAPDNLLFEGTVYYIDETGGAHFFGNDSVQGQEVFKWDYADETETKYLTIEQWGDNDYELSVGTSVQEYQFSDILPSEIK
ncbi:conserved hypothetical protein [Desulfamplus magnetovallimortis]|uniref:DUF4178 domain-containing protein n=1 Tax=Desulfamplus magnetovallimortis TaxID=1246637 RepID=A0A1W1HLA2_9BACT|nr:DUF4178 domain-containing protein [Desulfamplus magnetovallimortis]SLM33216.1 conserved hypothetical protein [Desulfamplus magnetovallimortis]